MADQFEIPAFLRRNKEGQPPMTTATTKAQKRKQIDVYRVRAAIDFRIDMANAESLAKAIAAVEKANSDLTAAGASVEMHRGMAKIPSPEKAA